MNIFKHMSVKWKIYLIALVSLLGFGSYLGFNVWVNTNNAKLLTQLRESYFPILEKSTQNHVNLERLAELLNNAAMTAETEFIDKAQATTDKMNGLFDEIQALEPEKKQDVADIKQNFNDYFTEARKITEDMLSGEADMKQLSKRAVAKEEKLKTVNDELDAFIAYAHAKFSGSIDTANLNSTMMLNSGFVIWGVCTLIMGITCYAIARIILGSINKVSDSLKELASGSADFSRKIAVVSEDEIGKLASSFNALLENLRIKTSDLMCMMQNMHTGLFTITEDETIHGEYSAFIENIFETTNVAGENYATFLFSNANLGADVTDQVHAAVTSLLGADEMMFEFNSHLLVKEYNLQLKDENGHIKTKILELDWDSIVTDEVITKIMVTVRDVTELRAMQAAAEEQKMELEIVGQILKLTPARFRAFAENAFALIDRNRSIIQQSQVKNLDVVAELFANMHTIKGNARTYQLNYITDVVHEAEARYDTLRKDNAAPWDPSVLNAELEGVRDALSRYMHILKEKLSFATDGGALPTGTLAVKKADVQEILDHLNIALSGTISHQSMLPIVDRLRRFDTQPLPQILDGLLATLPEIAAQLHKAEPRIRFKGEIPLVFNDHASTVLNVFSHVLKNSIDHGIETTDERLLKGKHEQGTITIQAELHDGSGRLHIFDDGRGLNIKRLREKLMEQGADIASLTPQRIAEGMFMSGVSTAETLTDISGRGVGMDAVKKYLNSIGCDIAIEIDGSATNDQSFAPFKLVVTLDQSVCVFPYDAPELAEVKIA